MIRSTWCLHKECTREWEQAIQTAQREIYMYNLCVNAGTDTSINHTVVVDHFHSSDICCCCYFNSFLMRFPLCASINWRTAFIDLWYLWWIELSPRAPTQTQRTIVTLETKHKIKMCDARILISHSVEMHGLNNMKLKSLTWHRIHKWNMRYLCKKFYLVYQ